MPNLHWGGLRGRSKRTKDSIGINEINAAAAKCLRSWKWRLAWHSSDRQLMYKYALTFCPGMTYQQFDLGYQKRLIFAEDIKVAANEFGHVLAHVW